jgi:RNA polymerase sigma factor (TIGR02999 family)
VDRGTPRPAIELRHYHFVRAEVLSDKLGVMSELVHEAYLRLVGDQQFDGRGHFFAAAAEAMRRILVESARRKAALKRGGDAHRLDLEGHEPADPDRAFEVLALEDALTELEGHDPQAAQLVKLRYYGGLGHQEAAAALGVSRRAADRLWLLARTWLHQHISDRDS